jgi:hypothetical protein
MQNINKKSKIFDTIYLIFIFIFANIFISALIPLLGFPFWKICTLFFFSSYIIFILHLGDRYLLNEGLFLVFIFVFLLTSFCAIYYQSLAVIIHNMVFLLVLFIFFDNYQLQKTMPKFINISTFFICLLIFGAYIAVLYALAGGKPTFSFLMGDGRSAHIYLTSATNVVTGRYIRPSGIYDEPGALSFFICALCLLRVLYNRNDKITFFMLIAGLITTSITHIMILLCFILYYLCINIKKKKTFIYILVAFCIVFFLVVQFYELFDTLLFWRFKINPSTNRIRGDTRTHLFINSAKLLDIKTFFWGLDETGFTDLSSLRKKYPGGTGENPLTQILFYGFFASWYYYVFLFVMFIAGMAKPKTFFIFLGCILLFLQRPYIESISYSFYFVAFFYKANITIKEYLVKNKKYFSVPYSSCCQHSIIKDICSPIKA